MKLQGIKLRKQVLQGKMKYYMVSGIRESKENRKYVDNNVMYGENIWVDPKTGAAG